MKYVKITLALGLGLALGACADSSTDGGTLHAAFNFDGPMHDVEYMAFAIYEGRVDCAEPGADAVGTATISMEDEFLPAWLEQDGSGGDAHPFADALFVLQPGEHTVCATPLTGDMEPTEHCASVEGVAEVEAGSTVEIVLYSQCQGDPTGILDAVVALNDPPHIGDLVIGPTKFITTCQWATVDVFASDPNGDALSYAWEKVEGPDDGEVWGDPLGDGSTGLFKTCTAGTYTLGVTVDDGHGGYAAVTFPVHVSDGGAPLQIYVNGTHVGSTTVLTGSDNVTDFYSYGAPANASANTGLEVSDTTLLFAYQEDGGPVSLVIINDAPNDGSAGSMSLTLTGLGNASMTLPTVQDDPGDLYTPVGSDALEVDWNWVACCTDGLALTFDDKFVCVDILVESNTGTGDEWQVLSGSYPGGVDSLPIDVPADGTEEGPSVVTLCHCLADAPAPPSVDAEGGE